MPVATSTKARNGKPSTYSRKRISGIKTMALRTRGRTTNSPLLIVAVAAYPLGAVPVGLLLGKLLKGIDIRDYGSGRTGATNALRALGWGGAVATLLGDALKGCAGVLIGRLVLAAV